MRLAVIIGFFLVGTVGPGLLWFDPATMPSWWAGVGGGIGGLLGAVAGWWVLEFWDRARYRWRIWFGDQ